MLSPESRERANEMVVMVVVVRGQLAYCECEGAKIQILQGSPVEKLFHKYLTDSDKMLNIYT